MKTAKLTDKQRQAIEHLERARSEGVALSAYARAHGLGVREIYDALAALRRKGALPRPPRGAKRRFVAVSVAPMPATPRGVVLCRVLIGGSAVIECGEWPPAMWLAGLLAERTGAAP
ncbi:MAG: hypothetical protein ACREVR_21155 [Burkholderiales bacterium]